MVIILDMRKEKSFQSPFAKEEVTVVYAKQVHKRASDAGSGVLKWLLPIFVASGGLCQKDRATNLRRPGSMGFVTAAVACDQ